MSLDYLISSSSPQWLTWLLPAVAAVVMVVYYLFSPPVRKMFKRPFGCRYIGHLHYLSSNNILQDLPILAKKHGSFIQLDVLNRTALLISDLETCREVMQKRPKIFRRPKIMENPFDVLNLHPHSVFIAEGVQWNRLRRIIAPPFNQKAVLASRRIIFSEIKYTCQRLKKLNARHVINTGNEMMRLTVRIVIRIALGDRCTEEDYLIEDIHDDTKIIFNFLIQRMIFPFPDWMWNVFQSKLSDDAKAANQRFEEVVIRVVEDERRLQQENKANVSSSKTFLQAIIQDSLLNKEVVSNEELVANVKTLLLAGSETTSVTLTWCLYYLSQSPDALEKAREETKTFFGLKNPFLFAEDTESLSDSEGLANFISSIENAKEVFPYCAACFKEAMRLSSPAPFIFLDPVSATESVTLSNGIEVNPTDTLYCFTEFCQKDSRVFESPLEFIPDRWLIDDVDKLQRMQAHMLPFGSGPRVCPGMNLANCEGEFILAVLVASFDFELACAPTDVKRILDFTAKAENVPMIFTPRNYV